MVRMKLFTLDHALKAISHLSQADRVSVQAALQQLLIAPLAA